jgi:hypothetical protein
MQSTNEKTLVTASINADYMCVCFHCGVEMSEKEGYISDGGRICDDCAYDLQVSEKPSAYYFDEDNEKFDEKAQEHVVNIMPNDAIIIDDDMVFCSTYDKAKERLLSVIPKVNSVTQELNGSFIVSQNNGEFWYMLNKIVNEPTMFKLYAFAPKDAVAKKYIRRMLEDCVYRMGYLENPEDYECQDDDDEDCATEEDIVKYYEEQDANEIAEEQKCMEQNDMDVDVNDYTNYYTNKALCVTCGEVNYAEPVCEVEGRSRMVCCDCIEIVNNCEECHNLTLDYLYLKENYNGVRGLDVDLCFECKFKRPLKEQMPLAIHLAIRRDIQFLTRQQFDILTDYAELCEFTIFDAYRYKSRCHCYDCDRMVPPSAWDAEEAVQFCCRRHCDISDLNGCHCQNVYDDSDYDEDWEQATCKVCNNSNHDTNMIPRIALRESNQGINPIVSAICVFNEELEMSNILAESLVDLCEYFI